jgi:energy-coupling factor transport system permease protein
VIAAGSALHRSRAAVAVAYLAVPCAAAVLCDHPLVQLALLGGLAAVGVAAGVGRKLARAARLAAPLAILVALVNPLVSREGLTVLLRGPVVPVLGRLDVTLEALVCGAVAGLRVLVIVLACALYSAVVDPDDVLRALRRFSLRSALSASMATRLLPVLGRDAERLREAYAFRAAGRTGPERRRDRIRRGAIVTRALVAGALDRAIDMAAALEVRGLGPAARRPSRRAPRPWSREELTIVAGALAGAALVIVGRSLGLASFDAYPLLQGTLAPADMAFVVALPATMVTPLIVVAVWRSRSASPRRMVAEPSEAVRA